MAIVRERRQQSTRLPETWQVGEGGDRIAGLAADPMKNFDALVAQGYAAFPSILSRFRGEEEGFRAGLLDDVLGQILRQHGADLRALPALQRAYFGITDSRKKDMLARHMRSLDGELGVMLSHPKTEHLILRSGYESSGNADKDILAEVGETNARRIVEWAPGSGRGLIRLLENLPHGARLSAVDYYAVLVSAGGDWGSVVAGLDGTVLQAWDAGGRRAYSRNPFVGPKEAPGWANTLAREGSAALREEYGETVEEVPANPRIFFERVSERKGCRANAVYPVEPLLLGHLQKGKLRFLQGDFFAPGETKGFRDLRGGVDVGIVRNTIGSSLSFSDSDKGIFSAEESVRATASMGFMLREGGRLVVASEIPRHRWLLVLERRGGRIEPARLVGEGSAELNHGVRLNRRTTSSQNR